MSLAPLATLFGLGMQGPAPGALGSLAALPLAYLLHRLGGFPLFAAGLALVVVLAWLATRDYMAGLTDQADPQEVVIDEVAGQMIALLPLSLGLWLAGAPAHVFPWPGWVGGFVMFRVFDVLKPPPISTAEGLPGALGVMADDLLAGVAAALVVTLAAAVSHGWLA